jgi:hypothetical protein
MPPGSWIGNAVVWLLAEIIRLVTAVGRGTGGADPFLPLIPLLNIKGMLCKAFTPLHKRG